MGALTDIKKEEMVKCLEKLKTAHGFYKNGTEEQKGVLMDKCQRLIDRLIEFGKDRTFYETLLMYGHEFLLVESGDEDEKLFGAFKLDVSETEQRSVEAARSKGWLVWTKDSSGRLVGLIEPPSDQPAVPAEPDQQTLS